MSGLPKEDRPGNIVAGSVFERYDPQSNGPFAGLTAGEHYRLSQPDPVTELVHLRAIVARMSHEVDGLVLLSARQMRQEIGLIADRMRAAVSTPGITAASSRNKQERPT